MENRSGRRQLAGLPAVAALVWIVASAQLAAAVSVDCDTPDDFCTGDPCKVTKAIDITVPNCVVDFGARQLIINGAIRVPNNGALSLTAGSIDLLRKINGMHAVGDGADIALHASGPIDIFGKVDASGDTSCGSIVIDAGGDIEISKLIRSRTRSHGAAGSGGSITIQSGGMLMTRLPGRLDVRGATNTAGGHVTIGGDGGVTLNSRIEATGQSGGALSIASAVGTVSIGDRIRATGSAGGGGSAVLSAGNDVRLIQRPASIDVSGRGAPGGGTIILSAGHEINVNFLEARGGVGVPGGAVTATAPQALIAEIDVRGDSSGGVVDVHGTGANAAVASVDARSASGTGGTVHVTSSDEAFLGDIAAAGAVSGGDVRIAANNLVQLLGLIDVTAPAGGTVDAHTPGDLFATGAIKAASGGCIGLSAGGSLNVAMATFDVPPSASCP